MPPAERPGRTDTTKSLTANMRARVVVTTAIAREMVGFIWAIARQVQLQPTARSAGRPLDVQSGRQGKQV